MNMNKLIISILLSIFTLNFLLACDPDPNAFCQTSNNNRFANMHIFAGVIASNGDQFAQLNVLSLIRGNESRTEFTIWNGPEIRNEPDSFGDCDYYASGFTNHYGKVGDTIFCIIELIDEKQNDWEVIGDYRMPPADSNYNNSFLRVAGGEVRGFDNLSYGSIPFQLFFDNPCTIIYGCTNPDACNYNSIAQADNGDCNFDCEKPEVNCPVRETYLCEPTELPPPLGLIDFDITDNVTPINELFFYHREEKSHFNQYTIYTHRYEFYDAAGNRAFCNQQYYMIDDTLHSPAVRTTIDICNGQQEIALNKPNDDHYYFYENNNGVKGEFMGQLCDYTNVLCMDEQLGIDTEINGTHQFWLTKTVQISTYMLFEGKPFFRCESEPVLITLNVNNAPKAALKNEVLSVNLGQYYNLMDLVEENKNGYWTGENILRFNSITGQQFYYFPKKTGFDKLFYTVINGDCTETYTQVVEVKSLRLADGLNLSDPIIISPNPTQGLTYVNLSNAIDVVHSIEVYDINGKLHYQQIANDVKNTLFELDLSDLPKGVYLVEARNEFATTSKRLIKQ